MTTKKTQTLATAKPTVKAKTLPASFKTPNFARIEQVEIHYLFNVFREATTAYIYQLIKMHADYKTGEFLGNYPRLVALSTPPKPERGRSVPGPSLEQVTRAVRDLISVGLLSRDAENNTAQGQLRLQVVVMRHPEEFAQYHDPITKKTEKLFLKGAAAIAEAQKAEERAAAEAQAAVSAAQTRQTQESAPAPTKAAASPAAATPSGSMAEELKSIADEAKKQRRQAYFEKNGYYPEEAKAAKAKKAA
jgi:hypothetical protein